MIKHTRRNNQFSRAVVVERSRASISWFSSHAQCQEFESQSYQNGFPFWNAKIRTIRATLIFGGWGPRFASRQVPSICLSPVPIDLKPVPESAEQRGDGKQRGNCKRRFDSRTSFINLESGPTFKKMNDQFIHPQILLYIPFLGVC